MRAIAGLSSITGNDYYFLEDSGVLFEKFILEIGAHHVYPGFLSWS